MSKLSQHGFSYGLILLWVIIWLIGQRIDLTGQFAGKGLGQIGHEYYRFGTSLFLHSGVLHLIANVTALYWIGVYVEPQFSAGKLCLFSMAVAMMAQVCFSMIYRDSLNVGGSPIVFALIGLIVMLNIMKKAAYGFELGTWYGNWILGYAVLSSLPILGNDISILVIHGFSLFFGMLFGGIAIGIRFF